MKILQIDKNHPLIVEQLTAKGFVIEEDHTSTYDQILDKIENYEGIIIRSRGIKIEIVITTYRIIILTIRYIF